MKQKIRIGIVGYGNLGKGAELAVQQSDDMELVAVFSRRDLAATNSGVQAVPISEAEKYKDKIDVMILCGGKGERREALREPSAPVLPVDARAARGSRGRQLRPSSARRGADPPQPQQSVL